MTTVVLLLLLAGCGFDSTPEDVACSSDEHCPDPGWACDLQAGRCRQTDDSLSDDDDSASDDDDSLPDDDDVVGCAEDSHEQDDTPATAGTAHSSGTSQEPNLSACLDDPDWFDVALGTSGQLVVTVQWKSSAGSLDAVLRDLEGALLTSCVAVADGCSLYWQNDTNAPLTVYLSVSPIVISEGSASGIPYSLTFQVF